MKNKTLTIILSAILLICIGGNIYQNMTTSKLRDRLNSLTNTKNELTAEIENKTTELDSITSEIETANTTIEELTARVDSLTTSINEAQAEIDSINSTHTDIELGDDEYKGDEATVGSNANLTEEEQSAVNQIEENLREKHPEWFADDTTGDNAQDSGYVSVDAPVDSGELTNPGSFGQGDYSEGAGAQVY